MRLRFFGVENCDAMWKVKQEGEGGGLNCFNFNPLQLPPKKLLLWSTSELILMYMYE